MIFDRGSSFLGAFFSPSGSRPGRSSWQVGFLWFLVGFHGFSRFLVGFLGSRLVVMVFHGFDSGLSLTGAVFFQVDLGLGAAVGGMQIEINTGYSCYFICIICLLTRANFGPKKDLEGLPPCNAVNTKTNLIFVTGATGGARVIFFGWCKFLQI